MTPKRGEVWLGDCGIVERLLWRRRFLNGLESSDIRLSPNVQTSVKTTPAFLKLRFHGVLTAAGAFACVATIAAMGGRFHWLLDLCSHFPFQYAVFLAASSVVLGLLRKRTIAAVFLVFALWNVILIFPQMVSGSISEGSGDMPVTALLINVRTENREFAKVRELVSTRRPDIVVFEEVKDEWTSELGSLRKEFGYVVAEPREDNFGIALFSKLPLRDGQVRYFGKAGVPSIIAHLQTSAGDVLIVATHTIPPVGFERFELRNEQLQRVAEYVKAAKASTILLGDLNTSPWSYHFKKFVRESGLIDTSRGHGWQPTWPTMLPPIGVPIDHCLCSQTLKVIARETGPNIGSDHYPVTIGLRVARRPDSRTRSTNDGRDTLDAGSR